MKNVIDFLWILIPLLILLGTVIGNIFVCLAIILEKRLRNITNYFLMSLAITDLMVALFVMPLSILKFIKGYFPLHSVYCLIWTCLDVLFCTSSIMHLCAISIDRYLSLRYPFKFGLHKTKLRMILKIALVWLLSITMSLPVSLMYVKDSNSVLIEGVCQISNPLYKLIGSIISFYIPLVVMFLTYSLTVKLLTEKIRNINKVSGNFNAALINSKKRKSFDAIDSSRNVANCNKDLTLSEIRRFGKIYQFEQKATKVLGIVFFTFVILWAPFFIVNPLPAICHDCQKWISDQLIDIVTWFGYSSSLFNAFFYSIFNKVFRKWFVKFLCCGNHLTKKR